MVKWVRSIRGALDDTKIFTYQDGQRKMNDINSAQVLVQIRSTILKIGEDNLGSKDSEIGMHSLISNGDTEMFGLGVSKIIIQNIGQWADDNFTEYIG